MKECISKKNHAFVLTKGMRTRQKEIARLSKALAHPSRVHILQVLSRLDEAGTCLNSDLVSELDLAQSTVSEHLKKLKQAGLITVTPKPPKMCYQLNKEKLTFYKKHIEHLLDE